MEDLTIVWAPKIPSQGVRRTDKVNASQIKRLFFKNKAMRSARRVFSVLVSYEDYVSRLVRIS